MGAGQKETGQGTSMFDANKGAIGSAFHKEGTIGQIGEKIGGPLASSGMIGKFDKHHMLQAALTHSSRQEF